MFPLFMLLFFIAQKSSAQQVPQHVLDVILKAYHELGTLDKSYLPKFSRAHPNDMYFYSPCYPGKKICVLSILPDKPKDWKFKLNYNGKTELSPKGLKENVLGGKTYYTDWIMTGFASNFSDRSDQCLNIVAYDGDAIDLPVYTYVFVFNQ